jgi:uncharacterized protein
MDQVWSLERMSNYEAEESLAKESAVDDRQRSPVQLMQAANALAEDGPLTPGLRARGLAWRIARTLAALLVAAVAVFGSMFAFRHGLLPLLQANLNLDEAWFSGLRRAGLLLSALLGYWGFARAFERRRPDELKLDGRSVLLGGASGALLVALPIALLFALGAYELVEFRGFSAGLWGVAAVIAIAATLEEIIYRCLLFRILERYWGTVPALVLQAPVFALAHWGNVEGGGTADLVLMLISVTLLGLLWAGVFLLTRNLWATAANHAAWNFSILLSGVPLSGIEDWRAMAPLDSRLVASDWLTGGMFGPENSLLVMVFAAAAVAWLLHRVRQAGALRPAERA